METATPPASWRARAHRLGRLAALAGVGATLGVAALALPANAAPAPTPDLEVTLGDYYDTMVGGELAITATVANVGTATAPWSTVHIDVPPAVGGWVEVSGTDGPGTCSSAGSGVTCWLGPIAPGESQFGSFYVHNPSAGAHQISAVVTPVPYESSVGNNMATREMVVRKYASKTTATAPATAQAGQRITIPVKVAYTMENSLFAALPPQGTPSGTVGIVGPEGVFQAQVINGVANVSYPVNYRGPHTVAVLYSGSALAATSSTTVSFSVL